LAALILSPLSGRRTLTKTTSPELHRYWRERGTNFEIGLRLGELAIRRHDESPAKTVEFSFYLDDVEHADGTRTEHRSDYLKFTLAD
jgi:hypothetical protein